MFLRTRMASGITIVCTFLVVVMEVDVLLAANPRNSSQTTVTDETELKKSHIEKGMDVLYDMTNSFLDVVQPNHLYEQTWFNLTKIMNGDTDDFKADNWKEYANYGIGFTVCLVFGILFAIFMPIVGCCFCCCRLCGNCGGKRKLKDPKRAKCKKTSYCTVLLIINVFSLAGVVCAFVTNDILHNKLENKDDTGPTASIFSAITTIQNYVNNTADSLESESLTRYDRAVDEITKQINMTAGTAVDRVLKSLNATDYLNDADSLNQKAKGAIEDLQNVNGNLEKLKMNGENLTTELTALKNKIQTECNNAGSDCSSLKLDSYRTDANFSKLSDFSAEITKIQKSLNISQFVDQAKEKIDEVKSNATKEIQKNINDAEKIMTDVRKDLAEQMTRSKDSLESFMDPLTDFQSQVNGQNENIKEYANYVWYGGIGISCVLLLIVVFYCLGVLFGLCGDRPGHGAGCCNTGVGGNFLMAGVAFSFFFALILMIVCIVLFIPGGLIYTEGCRYFQAHDPDLLKPFDDNIIQGLDIPKMLFNRTDVTIKLVDILNKCKDNKAVYSALHLENLVDLDKLLNFSNVLNEIDSISKNRITFNNITILTPELKEQIRKLGEAGLDEIDYTEYNAEIKKNITAIDLKELSQKISNYADSIQDSARSQQFKNYATKLENLDRTVVKEMNDEVAKLNNNLNELKKHSDVKNETEALITGLERAQTEFHENGVALVNEMIKNVSTNVKNIVTDTVGGIKDYVKDDAGKCRPLFDAMYLMTDSVCVIVLNPLNGFWFSVGWCLFFFIPSIIFAVKLSTLYHREEDYVPEKEVDEPNFAMYAGSNPDRIPLTSLDQPHDRGYGAHNTGYRDDGYYGKPQNGYPTHAEGPPPYDDNYYRGRQNGHRSKSGRPMDY